MFIYNSHMGGLYSSDEPIDYDDLYCERCGDSDKKLGNIETQEELLRLLSDDIVVLPEDGGGDMRYVLDFVHSCFPNERKIGRKKAKEIILRARTV